MGEIQIVIGKKQSQAKSPKKQTRNKVLPKG